MLTAYITCVYRLYTIIFTGIRINWCKEFVRNGVKIEPFGLTDNYGVDGLEFNIGNVNIKVISTEDD